MKPLVIVGTGVMGELADLYFSSLAGREIAAFAADAQFIASAEFIQRPLVMTSDVPVLYPPSDYELFIAIGYRRMNRIRQAKFEYFRRQGYEFATFVHPGVSVWSSTSIGQNCFIFEDNTLQPFTSIGDDTILWSGNHVGHHTKIGSHTFVSSHVVISGLCDVGDNVFMGVNSTVHDGIRIGDGALIGAGALVARDLPADSVVSPRYDKPRDVLASSLDF